MTYQDIHTFLTIASSSSLSKAAESLFVSQPALSHRLSALEEELGTELIIRDVYKRQPSGNTGYHAIWK